MERRPPRRLPDAVDPVASTSSRAAGASGRRPRRLRRPPARAAARRCEPPTGVRRRDTGGAIAPRCSPTVPSTCRCPLVASTAARFAALAGLAESEDLSVARLAEAHCDAAAIVAEAGRAAAGWRAGRRVGVAVRREQARRQAARRGWHLSGELAFCSGAGSPRHRPGRRRARPARASSCSPCPSAMGWLSTPTTAGAAQPWPRPAPGGRASTSTFDAEAAIGEPGLLPAPAGVLARGDRCRRGLGRRRRGDHPTPRRRRVDPANPHAAANLGRTFAATTSMSCCCAPPATTSTEHPTRRHGRGARHPPPRRRRLPRRHRGESAGDRSRAAGVRRRARPARSPTSGSTSSSTTTRPTWRRSGAVCDQRHRAAPARRRGRCRRRAPT